MGTFGTTEFLREEDLALVADTFDDLVLLETELASVLDTRLRLRACVTGAFTRCISSSSSDESYSTFRLDAFRALLTLTLELAFLDRTVLEGVLDVRVVVVEGEDEADAVTSPDDLAARLALRASAQALARALASAALRFLSSRDSCLESPALEEAVERLMGLVDGILSRLCISKE